MGLRMGLVVGDGREMGGIKGWVRVAVDVIW